MSLRDFNLTNPDPNEFTGLDTQSADQAGLRRHALDSTFRRGLRAGAAGLSSSALAGEALDAELDGDLEGMQNRLGQARQIQQESELFAPGVRDLREIDSVDSAQEFVEGGFGQGLGSMAPALAGAAAGALTRGKTLGLRRGPATMLQSGAAAYAPIRGEAALAQYEDPELAATNVEDRANVAMATGVGGAALESVVPAGVARALTGAGRKGAALSARRIARDAGEEALTEGAQTGLQFAGERYLDPNQTLDPWEVANTAAIGAITGGGISTGAQGARGALDVAGTATAPARERVGQFLSQRGDMAKQIQEALKPKRGEPVTLGNIKARMQRTVDSVEQAVAAGADPVEAAVREAHTEAVEAAVGGDQSAVARRAAQRAAQEFPDDPVAQTRIVDEELTNNAAGIRDMLMQDREVPDADKQLLAGMDMSTPANRSRVGEMFQRRIDSLRTTTGLDDMAAGGPTKPNVKFSVGGVPLEADRTVEQVARIMASKLPQGVAVTPEVTDKLRKAALAAVAATTDAGRSRTAAKRMTSLISGIHELFGDQAVDVAKQVSALVKTGVERQRAQGLADFVSDKAENPEKRQKQSERRLEELLDLRPATASYTDPGSVLQRNLSEQSRERLTMPQLRKVAEIIDDMLTDQTSNGRRDMALRIMLERVFGTKERVDAVLEHYNGVVEERTNQLAETGETDDSAAPDEDDIYADLEEGQKVNEMSIDRAPTEAFMMESAENGRPFRADSETLTKALNEAKAARAGTGWHAEPVPYAQALANADEDIDAAAVAVRDDIVTRMNKALDDIASKLKVEGTPAQKRDQVVKALNKGQVSKADMGEFNANRYLYLQNELSDFDAAYADGGAAAALDQYRVLKVSSSDETYFASEKDVEKWSAKPKKQRIRPDMSDAEKQQAQAQNEQLEKMAIRFKRTSGRPLTIHVESILKGVYEDRKGELLSAVAKVLARPDIASLETDMSKVPMSRAVMDKMTEASLAPEPDAEPEMLYEEPDFDPVAEQQRINDDLAFKEMIDRYSRVAGDPDAPSPAIKKAAGRKKFKLMISALRKEGFVDKLYKDTTAALTGDRRDTVEVLQALARYADRLSRTADGQYGGVSGKEALEARAKAVLIKEQLRDRIEQVFPREHHSEVKGEGVSEIDMMSGGGRRKLAAALQRAEDAYQRVALAAEIEGMNSLDDFSLTSLYEMQLKDAQEALDKADAEFAASDENISRGNSEIDTREAVRAAPPKKPEPGKKRAPSVRPTTTPDNTPGLTAKPEVKETPAQKFERAKVRRAKPDIQSAGEQTRQEVVARQAEKQAAKTDAARAEMKKRFEGMPRARLEAMKLTVPWQEALRKEVLAVPKAESRARKMIARIRERKSWDSDALNTAVDAVQRELAKQDLDPADRAELAKELSDTLKPMQERAAKRVTAVQERVDNIKKSVDRPSQSKRATKQEMADITDEIWKMRGKQVQVKWMSAMQLRTETGADGPVSGAFELDPKTGARLIRLATSAANPRTVAYHEAMHDFFQTLGTKAEARSLKRQLLAFASRPMVIAKLARLLAKNPAAIEAIKKDPEERLAYLFQFWHEGAIDLSGASNGPVVDFFLRLRDALYGVLGVVSTSKKMNRLMEMLRDGKLADPSTVVEAIRDTKLRTLGDTIERISGPLGELSAAVFKVAQDRMRDTNVPALMELADRFEPEMGESGMGFIQRRAQQTGIYLNKLGKILEGSTAEERKTATRNLQARKAPSTRVERELRAFLDEMFEYMKEAGVKRLVEVQDGGAQQKAADKLAGSRSIQKTVAAVATRLKNSNSLPAGFPKEPADRVRWMLEMYREGGIPRSEFVGNEPLVAKFQLAIDAGTQTTRKWVDLQPVKDYFPQVWDPEAIRSNEARFKALVEPYMGKDGAQALFETVTNGNKMPELVENEHHLGFTPFSQALLGRKLDFITAANAHQFAEFQSDELTGMLTTYIQQATHRAEYARDFGNEGEEINKLLSRAKTEGATDAEVATAKKAVMALEGTLGHDMSDRLKRLQANILTYQNIVLLPVALFSQFVDALGIGLRSGEFSDSWGAFKDGTKSVMKALTNTRKPDEAEEMARLLGIIDDENMLENMGQVYDGMYMTETTKRVNRWFFRLNGMELWNRRMRTSAMMAGHRFIIRSVDNTRYMKELGLTPADVLPREDGRLAVFAPEVLEELRKTNPKATEAQAEAIAKRVHNALFKFVDSAIVRPRATQRPVWMSDPRFLLIAHLKQFAFSFQKTYLARVNHEASHGNYMPALSLAWYVPFMMAADYIRLQLTGTGPNYESMSFYDAVMHGVQRSGVLGVGTFGADAVQDAEYGKVPGISFAGPTADHIYTTLQWMAGAASDDRMTDRTVPFARLAEGIGG